MVRIYVTETSEEIQGHSGEIFVDPLLPDDVSHRERTRDACHYSKWTNPKRKKKRRDRQSVFFTAVNPMDIQPDQREVEYDLDKPRIAPYKHTGRIHHNTVLLCNLKLAQRERDCDAIKLGRMQSLFQTHCQRFV